MSLSLDIQSIKGIGPAKAKLFANLGINTVRDILYYFPRDYEELSVTTFKRAQKDRVEVFPCIVTSRAVNRRVRQGLYITKLPITDGESKGDAVFFNQPYLHKSFYPNQKLLLIGKMERKLGSFEITNPELLKINKGTDIEIDKIRPVYSLTKGVSQNLIRNTIKAALGMVPDMGDILPSTVRHKHNLLHFAEAIRNVHFPKNFTMLERARERFVFEELLIFQLCKGLSKHYHKHEKRQNEYKDIDLNPLISNIPFSPTCGQKKVLEEIINDLKSEHIMNRLVQGDVGSGKTFVACAALYLAAKNGFQGVIMAPTEILANQHFQTLKKYLGPHDINVGILKGGFSEKKKSKVLKELKNGTINVLVGTHAIIQKGVKFEKLGMVITDEQQRFGVIQRQDLKEKGQCPDTLVMSATPIPRTVAMVLYSDLDISTIDTLPPGRQKVETFVVKDVFKKKVYDFMVSEVTKGRLAYVVCPAIEENELNVANIESHKNLLKKNYPELKTEILHSKIKPEGKDEIIRRFCAKDIHVLISTTVVEVGVDVPAATLMVIEDAERFGLAQLHQLRGRVGRSNLKSYCFLISGSNQNNARERLKFLTKCHDGFEVSRKDLEMRGPGEFLGIRQHGFNEFKLASFVDDMVILKETQDLADTILEKGYLSLPEYKNIKNQVHKVGGV